MADVVITHNNQIEEAIASALEHVPLFGIGVSDIHQIRFPVLSLREAIGRFTEAASGKPLDFEHA